MKLRGSVSHEEFFATREWRLFVNGLVSYSTSGPLTSLSTHYIRPEWVSLPPSAVYTVCDVNWTSSEVGYDGVKPFKPLDYHLLSKNPDYRKIKISRPHFEVLEEVMGVVSELHCVNQLLSHLVELQLVWRERRSMAPLGTSSNYTNEL